jgi:hypothetical protein
MGWFVSEDRVPVELEGCRCPGSPHDHDTVWLRAELGPEAGFAAVAAVDRIVAEARASGGVIADFAEPLGRIYARYGIVEWTFLDDDGEAVPVTPENIGRLKWEAVYLISDKGDSLYGETLLRPLVDRLSKSSRSGRTAKSTSQRRASSSVRPKQSRRSTTATTPRPRLVTPSSDGDSSSSPKKKSA